MSQEKKKIQLKIPSQEEQNMKKMTSPIPIDTKKSVKSPAPSPTNSKLTDFMKNPSPQKKEEVQKPLNKMTKEEKKEYYEKQAQAKKDKRQQTTTSQPETLNLTNASPKDKIISSFTNVSPKDGPKPKTQEKPKEIKKEPLEKPKLPEKNVSKQNPKDKIPEKSVSTIDPSLKLFSQVEDFVPEEKKPIIPINSDLIHPEILKVGYMMMSDKLFGTNSRSIAMLNAFKSWIQDYKGSEQKTIQIDLDGKIKPMITFLTQCRPLSTGMGNAIRYFKSQIHSLHPNIELSKAKEALISSIDNYINDRIIYSVELIVKHGKNKIIDGDVILTYSTSEVVEKILTSAHKSGKKFSVILIDSRPKEKGREMLKSLSEIGIQCTFASINSVSYMMKQVTKVFLGANSMLSNGNVVSRVGSATISMVAKDNNIPVVVCCETYKFSEKSQIDSLTKNELFDPNELLETDKGILIDGNDNLTILNLAYDLTPNDFVDMVITEIGIIPPSSVPVVIREYSKTTKK